MIAAVSLACATMTLDDIAVRHARPKEVGRNHILS